MCRKWLAIALLLCACAKAQAMPVHTATIAPSVDAWYIAQPSLPIVDVMIAVEGAGSISDPKGKEGRARFASLLLRQGTKNRTALEFQQALEEKAIELEFSVTKDQLIIHVRALRAHAKDAGALVAEALAAPRFEAQDAKRITARMASELARLYERPDAIAARALEEKIFVNHPYAAPMEGTVSSIAALSTVDAEEYVKGTLARERLTITAAGDVDASLLRTMLEPIVVALPQGSPAPAIPTLALHGAGETIVVPRPLTQRTVMFAASAPARSEDTFYALYLLNHAIGGNGLTSRLANALRQERGLVYGIDTDLALFSGGTVLQGVFASASATGDEATRAVKETLAEIAKNGLSASECDAARTYVLGAFPLDMDGTSRLSAMLMNMRRFHLGKDYLDKRQEYFQNVSCDAINALAREILAPQRFLFVAVGEPPKEAP